MFHRTKFPTTAKDVMSRHVLCVFEDDSCDKALEIFCKNNISGVPVINRHGQLSGILSMTDLIKKDLELSGLYRWDINDELRQWLSRGIVKDHMTPIVHTFGPDTPLDLIAREMSEHHIHRIVILHPDSGKVEGMITAFDLLKIFPGFYESRLKVESAG